MKSIKLVSQDTTELLYLGGTSSDAPMVMERLNGGTLTAYNIGRDHIGTVTHIFTAGGALVAEYSYDPWGRPRDPSTHALTGTISAPEPRFHRGFSGHEWIAAGALVGATTGAVTGAATGFLSNGLNDLVSGNKFMDGAWAATRSGMISGAISGVFSGGIAGGKKALESGKNVWWGSEVKNGRTQWSFFSSEKPYASICYDINTISNNVNDCASASFTEINDYYGGEKSYQDMCYKLGYKDGYGVETTPEKLMNLAGELFSTKEIKLYQLSNIDFATGLQRDNKLISVLFNYDSNEQHLDVIRSIRYYSTKTVIKFRIGSYTLNSLVN